MVVIITSDTVSPTLAAEPAMDKVKSQIAFGPVP
jgi:hypothetical protein